MPSIRIQRLQKELLKLLNTSLKLRIRDKRLSMVTFTEIAVTTDMMYAKIYFSYLNDDEIKVEEMTGLLTKSSGFFKKEIANSHLMRTIPDMKFLYDSSEKYSRKLEKIFEKIHNEEKGVN
jgi:ribosome-binding factor A